MKIILTLLFTISIKANINCPPGTMKMQYKQDFSGNEITLCQKKTAKGFVKHGPYKVMDKNKKILEDKWFMDGELRKDNLALETKEHLDPYIDVQYHFDYGCALHKNTQLYCWGSGRHYRLGNGREEIIAKPTAVKMGNGKVFKDITQFSLGTNFACALNKEGEMYCWGKIFDSENKLNIWDFPKKMKFLKGEKYQFKSLKANTEAVCGLTKENKVFCLGHNQFGSLGRADMQGSLYFVAPDKPLGLRNLENVKALRSGIHHFCALLNNQRVVCWGMNMAGQLGRNDLEKNDKVTDYKKAILRNIPFSSKVDYVLGAGGVDFLENIIQLESRAFSNCALSSNGQLFCWGSNQSGHLGNGGTGNFRVLEKSRDKASQREILNFTFFQDHPTKAIIKEGESITSFILGDQSLCVQTASGSYLAGLDFFKLTNNPLGPKLMGKYLFTALEKAENKLVEFKGFRNISLLPWNKECDSRKLLFGHQSACEVKGSQFHCLGNNSLNRLGVGTGISPIKQLTPLANPEKLVKPAEKKPEQAPKQKNSRGGR